MRFEKLHDLRLGGFVGRYAYPDGSVAWSGMLFLLRWCVSFDKTFRPLPRTLHWQRVIGDHSNGVTLGFEFERRPLYVWVAVGRLRMVYASDTKHVPQREDLTPGLWTMLWGSRHAVVAWTRKW